MQTADGVVLEPRALADGCVLDVLFVRSPLVWCLQTVVQCCIFLIDSELEEEARWCGNAKHCRNDRLIGRDRIMRRSRFTRVVSQRTATIDRVVAVLELMRKQLLETTFIITYCREIWLGLEVEHLVVLALFGFSSESKREIARSGRSPKRTLFGTTCSRSDRRFRFSFSSELIF